MPVEEVPQAVVMTKSLLTILYYNVLGDAGATFSAA